LGHNQDNFQVYGFTIGENIAKGLGGYFLTHTVYTAEEPHMHICCMISLIICKHVFTFLFSPRFFYIFYVFLFFQRFQQ